MLRLINGKPYFYEGTVNGFPYINEDEKIKLINEFKKEDKDIKIEELIMDEQLKKKADKLAELNLTHSKNKFLKLLTKDYINVEDKVKELQETVDILLGGEEFD